VQYVTKGGASTPPFFFEKAPAKAREAVARAARRINFDRSSVRSSRSSGASKGEHNQQEIINDMA
jgi:hypothetical protein